MTEWWTGGDPRLRLLRTASAITLLGLLIYAVIAPPRDIQTIGLLAGALLVDLGFEVGLRWPGGKP